MKPIKTIKPNKTIKPIKPTIIIIIIIIITKPIMQPTPSLQKLAGTGGTSLSNATTTRAKWWP